MCPLCRSLSLHVSKRQHSVLCLPSLLTELFKGILSKSLFSVSLLFFASSFHQPPSHPAHCYQINHLKNFPSTMLLLGFKTPSLVFILYRKMEVVEGKKWGEALLSPHPQVRLTCLFSEFPINLLRKLSTRQPMYLITAFWKSHALSSFYVLPIFSLKNHSPRQHSTSTNSVLFFKIWFKTQVIRKAFLDPPGQGLSIIFFSVKCQIVLINIPGFLGHTISVATIQLCCCIMKAYIHKMSRNECSCVPIELWTWKLSSVMMHRSSFEFCSIT